MVWVGVCLAIVAWECWCEFCVSMFFSLCKSILDFFFSYKYNDTQFSCMFEKKYNSFLSTWSNLEQFDLGTTKMLYISERREYS